LRRSISSLFCDMPPLPMVGSAPERIDRVANAIVEATAPLLDDFEVVRRAARVAIEAIAS
jgi:hypothetical protein